VVNISKSTFKKINNISFNSVPFQDGGWRAASFSQMSKMHRFWKFLRSSSNVSDSVF